MASLIGRLVDAARGLTAGDSPVSFAAPGQTILPMFGGNDDLALLNAYGANGTLYAIVSLVCRAYARPEWNLYRKPKADGRRKYSTAGEDAAEQRTEVTTHAALDLWLQPNPWMTGRLFREAGQQHQELVGEQAWVINRGPSGKGVPLSMWPVRPDRIAPVGDPQKFIAGFVYRAPDGELVPLSTDEVIWLRYPHPADPYRGCGPVQAVLYDLDAQRYSAQWNRNFFLNSAEPGGIIQVPNNLGDTEWERLVTRWRDSHQGVARAHRVAVLEAGAQWVDRKISQRDMQFVELRNVGRDVIREAFRINKFMLGSVDDVNRASAEAAAEVFDQQHTVERLDAVREVLNTQLLPMFGPTGEGVEFDYVSPVKANREAEDLSLVQRSTAYYTLIQAGFAPEVAAEVCGLPADGANEPPPPAGGKVPAAPGQPPAPAARALAAAVARFGELPKHNGHRVEVR